MIPTTEAMLKEVGRRKAIMDGARNRTAQKRQKKQESIIDGSPLIERLSGGETEEEKQLEDIFRSLE